MKLGRIITETLEAEHNSSLSYHLLH